MIAASLETRSVPVQDEGARERDRLTDACLHLQSEIDTLRMALDREKQAVEAHRQMEMLLRGKLVRAEIALGQLRQELVGWEGRRDLEPLFKGVLGS